MKPPSICEPLLASMPSGFCWKSMNGTEISSLSSTTAKCWKALRVAARDELAGCRAGRSRASSFCHCLRPLSGEVERDDRLAGAARAVVEVLLGVLDVGAAQRRVVLMT